MKSIKLPSIRFVLLTSAILVLTLYTGYSMAIEEPKYRVLEQSGKLELRSYEPMIIAEVTIDGTMKQASNRGFRLIADYIFGNNTSVQGEEQKISMTAPVTMEQRPATEKIAMTTPVTMAQSEGTDADQWRMHFVMPSEYTMATLPTPNNPRVQVREIPIQNYAAIRFSGFTGEKKVERKTQELLAWMQAKGLQAVGAPELARYNPPITPPLFRRNEVLIKYQ